MEHTTLAEIAAVTGAAGATLVLLVPRRAGFLAGVALLAAAEALLAVALSEDTLRLLLDEPSGWVLVGAGVVAVAALGHVFHRSPAVVPVAWPGRRSRQGSTPGAPASR